MEIIFPKLLKQTVPFVHAPRIYFSMFRWGLFKIPQLYVFRPEIVADAT